MDLDSIEEPDEDLLDVVSRSHSGVRSRSSRNASTKQNGKGQSEEEPQEKIVKGGYT